jgi:hypothetical protein
MSQYGTWTPAKQPYVGLQVYVYRDREEIVDGHVSFGDASKVNVKGQDKILIHCKDGNERFISNVYYMSDMKSNILSLEQLLECGYTVFMKERTLYLRDQDNRLLAQVKMTKNRMFKLNLMNVKQVFKSMCRG